ncbi:MAG: hypothetical protein EU547_06140 [Promethearchaeota archaeon]|nr:MAG: hypothetical protein EU547_06140 [Candidatus Lokiarchaeota archaeon]
MARKHYRHESLIQIFTVLGAVVGIATIIISIAGLGDIAVVSGVSVAGDLIMQVVIWIVGLVICVITLLAGIKPGDPIPLHWLLLFILAILLIVFGAGVWACVLVVIAALIGLIDDLS